ncbi:MAG: HpcH/HpaI aldolase/citrate lyase family protein [Thermomicrobiales bacterium]
MNAPRSVLICPATSAKMASKAAASDADLAVLDLEDAVAPSEKSGARAAVVEAFGALDWQGRRPAWRVNAANTMWCFRDLIEVVEGAGADAGLVVMPKAESAAQVAFVDILLTQLETALGLTNPVALHVQIESARGLANIRDIAQASPRIEALVWGPGDYAATAGMPHAVIGVPDEHDAAYPGHRFGYAMHELLVAARLAGVAAIDGPYADFRDLEGLRRSCQIARALGYDGKWCIHPGQVETVNEVFSPTEAEIAEARGILGAYEAATAAGSGAVVHDGVMVDAASIRMAESTLARLGRGASREMEN